MSFIRRAHLATGAVAFLLYISSVGAQSNGKFCEGELGEIGWDCEFLGTVDTDEIADNFSPLPGSPDAANPVVYKQIAGDPAFDDSGVRTDTAAIFALHDSESYLCMLAESNGEAALFDSPEGKTPRSDRSMPCMQNGQHHKMF